MRIESGNFIRNPALLPQEIEFETYLSRRRMQHPDVLTSDNMDQLTGLNIPNFDKVRLKRKYVGIG